MGNTQDFKHLSVCAWYRGKNTTALLVQVVCRVKMGFEISMVEDDGGRDALSAVRKYDVIIVCSNQCAADQVLLAQTDKELKDKPLLVVTGDDIYGRLLYTMGSELKMRFLTIDRRRLHYEGVAKLRRALMYANALKEGKKPVPYTESLVVATDDSSVNLLWLNFVLTKIYNYRLKTPEYENHKSSCCDKILFKHLESEPVQLLITSGHRWPQMDGFQLSYEMNHGMHGRCVPCLMMTAWDSVEYFKWGYQCGVVDYITLPFEYKMLDVLLRTHLEMSSIIDNAAESPWPTFEIDQDTQVVTAKDHPFLDGMEGHYLGEGMAAFTVPSGDDKADRVFSFALANTQTGCCRFYTYRTGDVNMLEEEMDLEPVKAKYNVKKRGIMRCEGGFKEGQCTLSFLPFPLKEEDDKSDILDESLFEDAAYKAEATLYAVVNTSLEIVKPFVTLLRVLP